MMHANNESEADDTETIYLDDTHQTGSSLIEDGAMRILMDLSQMMDTESNIRITTNN
jgi:hypothetical protein